MNRILDLHRQLVAAQRAGDRAEALCLMSVLHRALQGGR